MPTVLQAITESNTLSSLLERMEQSKNCLSIIAQHIPLTLQTSVAAGPLVGTEWCLLIRNASAVAKLKQLEPRMLAAIQASSIDVQSIRFKRVYD